MDIPKGYVPFPSMFLEAGEPLKLDLNIFMPLNKNLVKFRAKGQTLTLTEILDLRKKISVTLLANQVELDKVLADVSSEMANDLSNSAEVSEKLSHFAEGVLGSLSGPGKDNPAEVGKILDQSSQLVECILKKMKNQDGKNAFQEFLQLFKKNDEHPVDQHNRHVGTLSALVGLTMGLSSQEVQDLAFAGMVHDLYMKEMPTALADRHLFGEEVYMNKMDKIVFGQILSTYKWHIETLVNRLKAMPTPVSEGSIRIIEQHHEHFDGSGLNGLKGPKIYRPAKILRLIDDLVSVLNSADFTGGIKEAYEIITREHLSGYRRIYDPDILQGVKGPLHIT